MKWPEPATLYASCDPIGEPPAGSGVAVCTLPIMTDLRMIYLVTAAEMAVSADPVSERFVLIGPKTDDVWVVQLDPVHALSAHQARVALWMPDPLLGGAAMLCMAPLSFLRLTMPQHADSLDAVVKGVGDIRRRVFG